MHEAIKIVLQWHGPLTVQELTAIINERELYVRGDGNLLPVRQVSEKVSINYKKPNQEDLSVLTLEQAEKYIAEGHFAPGSMLPKVMAAVKFAGSRPGRKAIITSLYKALDALEGSTGTVIEG